MSPYEMLELTLKIDEGNAPSQQIYNYGSGGKLEASMSYALQQLDAERGLVEVDWDPIYYIAPCFPKAKPRRKFEGTDIDLVRALNDLRAISEKIPASSNEWSISNPTRESLTRSIPGDATHFGEIDMKDAFHWGKMHVDSQKYVVIHWKGKFYK